MSEERGPCPELARPLFTRQAQFGDVYDLHRRQSTFEADVAAWQRAHQ